MKRTGEAETLLEKSLLAKPDPRVASSLSKLAFSLGDKTTGLAVLANWGGAKSERLEMRREYAGSRIATGDLVGARRDYEALLKQHPNDPLVLNNLAWLIQKDDPNRALTLVTLANKISPASATMQKRLAG